MKINLNQYVLNRPIVQSWWRKDKELTQDPEALSKAIAAYAVATHCPCVAIAHYIAEDIGYNQILLDKIAMLMAFYGYTDVGYY